LKQAIQIFYFINVLLKDLLKNCEKIHKDAKQQYVFFTMFLNFLEKTIKKEKYMETLYNIKFFILIAETIQFPTK
jgi:hypothetical protein